MRRVAAPRSTEQREGDHGTGFHPRRCDFASTIAGVTENRNRCDVVATALSTSSERSPIVRRAHRIEPLQLVARAQLALATVGTVGGAQVTQLLG
jgi:hypothetical protein